GVHLCGIECTRRWSFFFSSRRRHTRCYRDWSSDVCSSDLVVVTLVLTPVMLVFGEIIPKAVARAWATSLILRLYRPLLWTSVVRSEERRVGKECRSGGAAYAEKKKNDETVAATVTDSRRSA